MQTDWRTRYDWAVEVTQQAAKLALGYFEAGLEVEWKADHSPVTLADRAAEELLRQQIQRYFPHDGFLGEEFGDQPGSTGFRWIIDPIDGTRSFVRNIPLWATLVGLEYRDEPIAGVVCAPAFGHTYRALRGDGAFRNDRRIHVSQVSALNQAVLAYSSLSWFRKANKQETFLDLLSKVQRSRGYGDYYGFVLVAQGSVDAMVEHGVHAWDVAATRVLVEEAGGRFTDWDGTPTIHRPDVLATNGTLHAEILQMLQG